MAACSKEGGRATLAERWSSTADATNRGSKWNTTFLPSAGLGKEAIIKWTKSSRLEQQW